MLIRSAIVGLAVWASAIPAVADPAPNVVTDWAQIAQQAIHNAAAPRSAGTSEILHAMVMIAAYDAAVAVQGGYEPFAVAIGPVPYADVRAAVATAAYRTARGRVAASQLAYLDQQYAAYMSTIPDGVGRTEGVRIGEAVAAGVLARRSGDRFDSVRLYECSGTPTAPGEFEPDTGCPTGPTSPQPVDVKVGLIAPFTFDDATRFRPDGPDPLTSSAYAEDFAETRDLGRVDSVLRSPEQTDLAYFWTENPYVHWNRNLIGLAESYGLDVLDTARLFAMVHTAAADAIIVGFEAKYHYAAWRPRTAIPRADEDGNPDTDADPGWQPLLKVNHPEYPSGHGFWSTAVVDAVGAYFRTNRVAWTLRTSKAAVPALVQTERTYDHLNTITREIGMARIWGGLHWRQSMRHGEQIGRRVAAHVTRHFFRPSR